MPTVYRRSTNLLASVLTTRLINIPTSPTTVVRITSGAKAIFFTNIGASTVVFGDTSLTAGSGNILFYSMSDGFNPVQGDFAIYFIADSAQGRIAVNEYV